MIKDVKFCMYETYIGKTIGDHINGFKTRMNNHITESRSGVSTFKFPIHVFNCIKRNNRQLQEPFFYIYVKLFLKSNSRLESLETLLHKKVFFLFSISKFTGNYLQKIK